MGPPCAWPASLSALFTEANVDATDYDEGELCGPYNALLDFYFPWEEGWNVVPEFRRPRNGDTLDFITSFLVTRQKVPFLFLEVKPASHVEAAASRAAADDHMRDIFLALSEAQVPTLHGFSALGSRLCHYSLNTATGELSPHQIPKDPRFLTDTAPAAAWNLDILRDEGDMYFQNTVCQIKRDLDQHTLMGTFRQ